MTEVVYASDGGDVELVPYTIGKFTFSASGLRCDGQPTFEEWEAVGRQLSVQVRGIQFQVGDWLRMGDELFGELATQAIDARAWSESTVRVYEHVAKKVPMENRMIEHGLDYSHHQVVSALPPRQQRTWLTRALGNGSGPWSVSRLKTAIKAGADKVPTAWYVLVTCRSAADQEAFAKQTELAGRACKTITKR